MADVVAVGGGELPHGVAVLEGLGNPVGRRGRGGAAAVGYDVAHVVAVDITGRRVPCGQRPCVVGYGESPDGFSPLHDVADATRVGLGFARLHGRGWGWRGRGCGAAGGVGVQVPLPCVAAEQVEVDGTPRVDDTGAAVLSHGLAVRAQHPRIGLIAGRAHVRVLGDPQTVSVADVLRDGAGDRAGIQQWAHTARKPFALTHEAAYPVPIAPCGVVVHLPVERHDAVTPIVRRIRVEELGFGLRIASHGVMVEAEFLAGCLRLGDHAVGVRVDAGHEAVVVDLPGAPCGADDNEVGLRVGDVDAALPVGHVDALHVRVRGRRERQHAHGGDERRDFGEQPLIPWFRLAFVFELAQIRFPSCVLGGHEIAPVGVGGG